MCCKKNSFLITEGERAYIRNLYGLLTEATGEGQITITADSTFGSGKYSQLSQEGIEELQGGLERASTWMTENKGSLIFVQIVAVESQLTNYDTEQDPKVPVAEKVLSRLRAKTLKRYLIQYFQSLVASGVLTEMPIFQEPKIERGPTKYVKGQTVLTPALLKKYETEQKVSVELKLMAPEKCLVDLEVEVKYEKEPNTAFPCRGGHTCNDANFEVKMNGVPIGRANLNNANDSGSRTSGIIKIDDAKAKDIIGVNSKEILFSLKCLSGQNCHSGTPEVIIKKNGETIYHSCSPAMSRGDQNEYPIHTLDPCGNVLKKGTGDATNKDAAATTQTTETVNVYKVNFPKKESIVINNFDNPKRLIYDPKSNPKSREYTVGTNGVSTYDDNGNYGLMDIDPGTKITFIPYGAKNDKPVPNMKKEILTWGDSTSSGKYYVESEQRPNTTEGYTLYLKPGTSPRILDDEKSKNIVRFKLDDDAIEDFEKYYIPSKIVEKTPDGMYKVIANKMTYASNVYNKGTILKLDS
jgi:lipoprotein-anchoring transpeptidase ErfK/SrfK